MSESMKLKSSLLGGYNKQEVLRTIEQLSEQAVAGEEKYKDEIKGLKNENKVLTEEVQACKSRIVELESELEDKNRRIELLLESLRTAELELVNKRNEHSEQKKEMDRIRELQSGKEAHYERISKGIGDMMVNVKATCDTIISNSKEDAAAIIDQANKEIYQIGSQMRRNKQRFSESRGHILGYIKNIEDSLNHIYEQLDTTEAELMNEKMRTVNSEEFKKCEIEIENRVADLIACIQEE